LGLNLSDLFPPRASQPGAGHSPIRRPFNAGDLIDLAATESGIAAVISSDLAQGKADADRYRLLVAAGRLADVWEAVHGGR
jgi:hypothetical protein